MPWRIRPISENIARIGNNTFALPVGAETSLRWQVYSANQQVSHYRFLLLVNGEQTFLTIDGDTVPYVDLNLSAEAGIQTFDLEIPVQDEGIYDIVLIVLSNIDQPPQPTGTVASTSINRITLVVGEAEVSTNDFEVLPSSSAMTEQQLSVALGVSLDGSLLGWSYPDPVHRVQSGDPIRFDVLAGYASPSNPGDGSAPFPETSPFALLLFLDYTQIPLIDDQMILYRSVPQDAAYTNISLELPALNELGLHEILVVRINNPGVPMCQQRGLPTDLWLDWSTIHLRAALQVVVAP